MEVFHLGRVGGTDLSKDLDFQYSMALCGGPQFYFEHGSTQVYRLVL
jgi:hypothetical protein